jgi:HlyD family secretion protein
MTRRHLLLGTAILLAVAAFAYSRRGGGDIVLVDVTPVTRTASLQSFVTASGEIVAVRFADIGSAAMGRLVSLAVKEGDNVRAGQLLARVDPIQAASAADGAAAALRALESEAEAAAEQISANQADLAAAESRAAEADRQLNRAQELSQAGLIAQSELDAARANAEAASAAVRAAEAAGRRLAQSRTAAERRVAQGRADTARARDQLAKTDITAPIDGVVTRLEVEEGEMVVIGLQNQPGTILMTISDLSAINAEVKVAEADVLRVALGNKATVTLEAVPGRTFKGEVVEIGASALPQTGPQAAAREFKVKVRLTGDLSALRPGLTSDADILVAERANVLTVPLQAVVQRPGPDARPQVGVFVVEADTAVFTPVTTGIIGGLAIEIEGIPEGKTILSGPFQVLREIQTGTAVKAR